MVNINMPDKEIERKFIAGGLSAKEARKAAALTSYDRRFEKLEDSISSVKKDLERLDSKMDSKFETMDFKFEAMNSKFETMDFKFEAMNSKFEALESKVDLHFKVLAIITGFSTAVITSLAIAIISGVIS